MICFFTYLITFQSLQHIYKHPPTHVFASAADDTCTCRRLYRQAYRHGNSILSQDSRTLYFFYPKLRHAPVSRRCGMNAVPYPICVLRGRCFTQEGFEHFIIRQIHRLVLNGYPKANPSDSFIEPVKAVKGAPSTSFRLGLARKERSSKAR